MEFNHQEKKAISRILSDMIKADGKVDIGEAEFLYQVSSHIGLTTQLQDEALKMKSEEAIKILQGLSRDRRAEVVQMLHSMAGSDGKMDPNEMNIILRVIHPEMEA